MGTDIDQLLANYSSAVGATTASKNTKALMGKSNQVVSPQLGADHEGG